MPFRFYIITMFLFLCFSSPLHIFLLTILHSFRASHLFTPLFFLCDIILAYERKQ